MMASATSLNDIDEQFLRCSICKEQLKEPKILPCLHRYCRECLEELVEKGAKKIECVTCREQHTLPKDGIGGLKTDFITTNIIEFIQLQDTVKVNPLRDCIHCNKKLKASAFCFRCNGFLCGTCHEFHASSSIVKDHHPHIFSLREAEAANLTIQKLSSLKEAPRCQVHPEKRSELCCTTCDNLPVCIACTYGEHKGHDLTEVTSLAKIQREMLSFKVVDLMQHKEKAYQMPEEIRKTKEKLDHDVEEEKLKRQEHLDADEERFKKKIRNAEEELKRKQAELVGEVRAKTSMRKEDLEKKIKKLREEYELVCEEDRCKADASFKTLEEENKRETEQLQEGLRVVNNEFNELLTSLKTQKDEQAKKIRGLSDHFDKIVKRIETVITTVNCIRAAENDWADVQCIPDVCRAINRLSEYVKKGSTGLGNLSAVKVRANDDEVTFVGEKKATPEQIARAEKLLLPSNFFLYEGEPPSPGCVGCDEGEFEDPSLSGSPSGSTPFKSGAAFSPTPSALSAGSPGSDPVPVLLSLGDNAEQSEPAGSTPVSGFKSPLSVGFTSGASEPGVSSLADMFRLPAGSWACDSCCMNNSKDQTACWTCTTPKPEAQPLQPTASLISFGDPEDPSLSGSPSSSTPSKFEAVSPSTSSASSVGSPGPGPVPVLLSLGDTPEQSEPVGSTPVSGFKSPLSVGFTSGASEPGVSSLADMFRLPAGAWACDSCGVNNSKDQTACWACTTSKPEAQPLQPTASLISFGGPEEPEETGGGGMEHRSQTADPVIPHPEGEEGDEEDEDDDEDEDGEEGGGYDDGGYGNKLNENVDQEPEETDGGGMEHRLQSTDPVTSHSEGEEGDEEDENDDEDENGVSEDEEEYEEDDHGDEEGEENDDGENDNIFHGKGPSLCGSVSARSFIFRALPGFPSTTSAFTTGSPGMGSKPPGLFSVSDTFNQSDPAGPTAVGSFKSPLSVGFTVGASEHQMSSDPGALAVGAKPFGSSGFNLSVNTNPNADSAPDSTVPDKPVAEPGEQRIPSGGGMAQLSFGGARESQKKMTSSFSVAYLGATPPSPATAPPTDKSWGEKGPSLCGSVSARSFRFGALPGFPSTTSAFTTGSPGMGSKPGLFSVSDTFKQSDPAGPTPVGSFESPLSVGFTVGASEPQMSPDPGARAVGATPFGSSGYNLSVNTNANADSAPDSTVPDTGRDKPAAKPGGQRSTSGSQFSLSGAQKNQKKPRSGFSSASLGATTSFPPTDKSTAPISISTGFQGFSLGPNPIASDANGALCSLATTPTDAPTAPPPGEPTALSSTSSGFHGFSLAPKSTDTEAKGATPASFTGSSPFNFRLDVNNVAVSLPELEEKPPVKSPCSLGTIPPALLTAPPPGQPTASSSTSSDFQGFSSAPKSTNTDAKGTSLSFSGSSPFNFRLDVDNVAVFPPKLDEKPPVKSPCSLGTIPPALLTAPPPGEPTASSSTSSDFQGFSSAPKSTDTDAKGATHASFAGSGQFDLRLNVDNVAASPPKPKEKPTVESPAMKSPGLSKSAEYYQSDEQDDLDLVVTLLEKMKLETSEEEEEGEEVRFQHRAELYRWNIRGNQWKERGVGDITVLFNRETKKYRIFMRREQVYKVCANHFITEQVALQPNAGCDRSWMWHAMDDSDGEVQYVQLAVRFKSRHAAKDFKDAVDTAKKDF